MKRFDFLSWCVLHKISFKTDGGDNLCSQFILNDKNQRKY